ncbi:MAG: hypothetical protein PVF58_10910 [Candidatus Methanofastidiosia archaeon]|jgi:hypothetical protein
MRVYITEVSAHFGFQEKQYTMDDTSDTQDSVHARDWEELTVLFIFKKGKKEKEKEKL